MPAGARYIRDERRRLANLVASADLWSERGNVGATQDADLSTDPDSDTALVEYPGPGKLESLRGQEIHRRFQVRAVGPPRLREVRSTMSPCQDVLIDHDILVGRWVAGGGDHDYAGADEAGVMDLEAVRNAMWHPDNRVLGFSGATAPLYTIATTGRRVQVTATDFELLDLPDEQANRQVWRLRVESWLRPDREAALA